jgi:Tfp pilus assembly protein PilN
VIRTNLSTRPFYNERAVHVALGVVALAVLVLTIFNVTYIVRLSREKTELAGRIARDQAEAGRLTGEAASIRRGINKDELELVASAAREANDLIDQRTFSWTAFFNYIEATLPPDVMLVAVRPTVKDQQTRVGMTVLARRTEDIDEFVEKLEATGAFENVFPAQASSTEQGLQRAVLDSVYVGGAAEPDASDAAAPDVPAPGPKPRPADRDPGTAGAAPSSVKPATKKLPSGARP